MSSDVIEWRAFCNYCLVRRIILWYPGVTTLESWNRSKKMGSPLHTSGKTEIYTSRLPKTSEKIYSDEFTIFFASTIYLLNRKNELEIHPNQADFKDNIKISGPRGPWRTLDKCKIKKWDLLSSLFLILALKGHFWPFFYF